MLPEIEKIEIYAEDTIEFMVRFLDDLGNPIQLDGSTLYYTLFSFENSNLTYSQQINPTGTQATVFVPSTATKTPGEYIQEIRLVLPTGNVYTMRGRVDIVSAIKTITS
ncbi:hypothetical protein D9V84_11300 [Bacteroidetes/Chlorobi group bacterium Naka2016]|jgi:hypothetical protein|nr:MAG: hypothetical protein D9V84_11300 [Bacteroidetes/Chlorobi group bacterium Naka2016]